MNLQVFKDALPEILTQLLGFLIVFWVLKTFAFKSILAVVDARRKKIEDEFTGLEHKKRSLEDLEKGYRLKLEKIDDEARLRIQDAANVGVALARDIQDKARQDAQKMIDRSTAEISQDIAKARLTMRGELVELSALISEKIISEKLDAKEHEKLVDRFLKDLQKV